MARIGLGSYLSFGEKSATYTTDSGAAADIDVDFKLAPGQDGLQIEKDAIFFESLTDHDITVNEAEEGQFRVTGSIALNPTWGGLQNLLRWFTGHNVAVSGTSPLYTYAFVPVDYGAGDHYWSGANLNGIVELYRNETAGSLSTFYQGIVFNELTMTFEPNAHVEMSLGCLGRTGVLSAKSSPTFATDPMYTPTGQSTAFLTLDGTTYSVRNASVTVSNGYDFNYDVTGLGSNKPQPTGKREIRLEAEVETDTDVLQTTLLDWKGSIMGGSGANTLTLENTVGAATHSLAIGFNRLILESPAETHVGTHGVITASISARAVSSASGTPAYTVTLKNGDSAYGS